MRLCVLGARALGPQLLVDQRGAGGEGIHFALCRPAAAWDHAAIGTGDQVLRGDVLHRMADAVSNDLRRFYFFVPTSITPTITSLPSRQSSTDRSTPEAAVSIDIWSMELSAISGNVAS